MAIAFISRDSAEETSTDNTMTSASLSPAVGSILYVSVVGTNTVTESPVSGSVSGLSGTWTELDAPGQSYGDRRCLNVYRGTGCTGTGTLTITTDSAFAQDMAYIIDEVTGVDSGTPDDTPVAGTVTSGNLTLGDVGTVDAGDAVYVIGAWEQSGSTAGVTGYAEVTGLGSLSNVRQLRSWFDTTSPDETPNLTSTTGHVGGVAFVINVGAAAGGQALSQLGTYGMNTLTGGFRK